MATHTAFGGRLVMPGFGGIGQGSPDGRISTISWRQEM
jgi:hypothetical protein